MESRNITLVIFIFVFAMIFFGRISDLLKKPSKLSKLSKAPKSKKESKVTELEEIIRDKNRIIELLEQKIKLKNDKKSESKKIES